jgi:hypothetical protein
MQSAHRESPPRGLEDPIQDRAAGVSSAAELKRPGAMAQSLSDIHPEAQRQLHRLQSICASHLGSKDLASR